MFPGTGAQIPLQPTEKTMVTQVVPLQTMEHHSGADTHAAARGGPHVAAGGHALKEAATHGVPTSEQAPGRRCSLWKGSHARAGSWQGLRPMERSPWRSRFSSRNYGPWKTHTGAVCSCRTVPHSEGPTLEQFLKNCSPWEGPMLEHFVKDRIPWEGPHAGAGEECEESSP